MNEPKPNPAETEYADIFAKLAADEEPSEAAAFVEAAHEEVPAEAVAVAEETATEQADTEPEDEEAAFEPEAETEPTAPPDEEEAAPTALTEVDEAAEAEVVDATANLPAQADDVEVTASLAELRPAIEAVLFVADEPVPFNLLCKVLGDVNSADVQTTLVELMGDYEARNSGLELREIGGGWRISTRPQHHEFIRKYLKSKPSARLSLPALETLAVIAYKQPVTVPEILEIRGVTSSSAIKTLLEKRLIVTKGRKETVGRPMMYGTSKEFLLQFGLRDLNELPSMEDFEELAS